MSAPKLSKLELQIMEKLWDRGEPSIREIQEAFPAKGRPQLHHHPGHHLSHGAKKVLRRVRKVGNFHIFEPLISRHAAQKRLVDELLALFGGRTQPLVAHLVEVRQSHPRGRPRSREGPARTRIPRSQRTPHTQDQHKGEAMILSYLSASWSSLARPLGDHLWQSTLFVALAAAMAFALRSNPARIRYGIWLAASLKFLVPFALFIALGTHLATTLAPARVPIAVSSTVEDFSQPFALQAVPVLDRATPAAAPSGIAHRLPAIAASIWFAESSSSFSAGPSDGYASGAWSAMPRPSPKAPSSPLSAASSPASASAAPIRLVFSPQSMEPGIFGIFRPVLIWPEGISPHLDGRHIEAILAHEVCHVRRRDNLTAALHMLVEAVFWFHPLVWWMGARLEAERERACDEEVSLLCSQPHIYAESILKVCKFCSESPLACVSGITGADLKKRIVQIMTGRVIRKLDVTRKLLLLGATFAVVAVPIFLGQVNASRGLVHSMQVRAQSAPPNGTGAMPVRPMAADAHPSFEVAAIKPHDPNSRHQGFKTAGNRFTVLNQSVTSLMMFAYSINKRQVTGGPDWAGNDSFDIEGTMDTPGEPSLPQMQEMLRKLLADRFGLKFHREKRELPVFAVQIEKGGPRLTPAVNPDAQPDQKGANGSGAEQTMTYTSSTIADFAFGEQFFFDRPIVDQTGLTGRYDFTIHYTWDETKSTEPNAPPGFLTAIKEQLGLKFQPAKAVVDIFVIDQLEKPSIDGAEAQTTAPLPSPYTSVPGAPAEIVPIAGTPSDAGKTPPVLIYTVTPEYTDSARKAGSFGEVLVGVLVDANGNPTQVRVLHGIGMGLDEKAVEAVRKYHFAPATQHGKRIPAQVNVLVKFQPDPQTQSPPRAARDATAAPTFEVTTVKPADPNARFSNLNLGNDDVRSTNLPIDFLLQFAYGLSGGSKYQIVGAPAWTSTTRFDIAAKMDEETAARIQKMSREERMATLRMMVRSLLASRFGLAIHHEIRTLPVLSLTVSQDRPKLVSSSANPTPPGEWNGLHNPRAGQIEGRDVTTADLASDLSNQTEIDGQLVVDNTGLQGKYNFTLTWAPENRRAQQTDSSGGPSLFTALKEQLGLQLESRRVPVDCIVIDHIEPPSAN